VVEVLANLLRTCGFRNIHWRQDDYVLRTWDRPGAGRARKIPDIIATAPQGANITYVIDVRIAWNLTTGGGVNYERAGQLAAAAEAHKRNDAGQWRGCIADHPAFHDGTAEFVPFGVEISGGLGPRARRLWDECMKLGSGIRDTTDKHWTAASFRRYWEQILGVTLIYERGKVGAAAAKAHWPRRNRREGLTDTEPCGMAVL